MTGAHRREPENQEHTEKRDHPAFLTVKSRYVTHADLALAALAWGHDVRIELFATADPLDDEHFMGEAETTYRITGANNIYFAYRWRLERGLRGDGRV